jgi:hypothetical protein
MEFHFPTFKGGVREFWNLDFRFWIAVFGIPFPTFKGGVREFWNLDFRIKK